MVVYTLVYASLSGHAIDLQKMPILAKKIIFVDEDYFDLGKIVTFVAQKTRTYTLKSQRNQNESLFGADFGPEA